MRETADEIELLKQSAAVCEAALHDLEQAIRPGATENELLGVFWHKMLALGGEHCSTRLLVSGHKTNPWFHEAGSKLVPCGGLPDVRAPGALLLVTSAGTARRIIARR